MSHRHLGIYSEEALAITNNESEHNIDTLQRLSVRRPPVDSLGPSSCTPCLGSHWVSTGTEKIYVEKAITSSNEIKVV